MKITCPLFDNNSMIPQTYTCDSEDINPPLKFEDIPPDAASLTLTVTDPDAPGKTFVHWVVFNINPAAKGVVEDSVPADSVLGTNDFQDTEYNGPCPPSGTHHYIFTLYAVDTILPLGERASYEDVMEEMQTHILETAQLHGVYSK